MIEYICLTPTVFILEIRKLEVEIGLIKFADIYGKKLIDGFGDAVYFYIVCILLAYSVSEMYEITLLFIFIRTYIKQNIQI